MNKTSMYQTRSHNYLLFIIKIPFVLIVFFLIYRFQLISNNCKAAALPSYCFKLGSNLGFKFSAIFSQTEKLYPLPSKNNVQPNSESVIKNFKIQKKVVNLSIPTSSNRVGCHIKKANSFKSSIPSLCLTWQLELSGPGFQHDIRYIL